jgi:hypothetical protein
MIRMLSAIVLAAALAGTAHAQSLQDLINAAEPGAVVTVPAGAYQGPVQLKDGQTLFAEAGPDATSIDGAGSMTAVALAKDTAVIGFTLKNAQQLIRNNGNFFGLFECILTNYSIGGVAIEKGSGALMNNLVTGTRGTTGILCIEANPYVGYNVIANNQTGFTVARWLIPTLDHNVFLSNDVAVASLDGTAIVMTGNVFDGNRVNANGVSLGSNDVVRAATAEELALRRGLSVDSYRALMKKVYEESLTAQPRIIYDLTDELGKFNLIVTYPYATFTVSASAKDTIIRNYDAYDRQTDASLHAQYLLAHGGHPSVAVINPQITDKAIDRFVLEKLFEHLPSYHEEADGRRVFTRLTNLPRIEVLLPAGWTLADGNPGITVEPRGNRQVAKLASMGMTTVTLTLVRTP